MNPSSKLACTAFEEFMLAQDYAAFPCVICLRMAVVGKLNRELFSQAINWMIQANPLFRSRLTRDWLGKSHWQIQPKSDHSIDWQQSATEPDWPTTRAIDLFKATGLLVEAIEVNSSSLSVQCVIFMHVHHAVADGLGIMNAVYEMWLHYDALYAYRALPAYDRAPSQLSVRNRFGLSLYRLMKLIPKQCVGLLGVRQYLMRNPKPMVDSADPNTFSDKEERIHAITLRLSCEESQRLRQAARVRGQTVNDIATGIVFGECLSLRQQQRSYQDNEWLRMMIPMSMRGSEEHRNQTACNIVSCVFLDRTPQQIHDREALIQSVHDELDLIKRNRLGFVFILSIWLKKWLSFRGSNVSKKLPHRCQTSLVFTNLGRVLSDGRSDKQRVIVGGATLEQVEILAPLTPWMTMAFIACQYAGEFQLTLRFDSRCVLELDAKRLLSNCISQLRLLCERLRGST